MSLSTAFLRIFSTLRGESFLSSMVCNLLKSALFTETKGFSVVAPIRINSPDSTKGRRASCWALLKRWISSIKRTQLSSCRPLSIVFLSSGSPPKTALKEKKGSSNFLARSLAIVVFPQPGGPQKIILVRCSLPSWGYFVKSWGAPSNSSKV